MTKRKETPMEFISLSEQETFNKGYEIASKAKKGDIYCLTCYFITFIKIGRAHV